MYFTTRFKLKESRSKKFLRGIMTGGCVLLMLVTGCTENALQEPIQEDAVQSGEISKVEETDLTVALDKDNIEKRDVQEKTLGDVDSTEIFENFKNRAVTAEIVENWTLTQRGNFTYVNGSLLNTGDKPIGFFRIKAEYVTEDGQVVDTESMVYNNVVWPKHKKRFEISNKYDNAYKTVRIWIDEIEVAKQPVTYIKSGLDAEIVPGWTWSVDGAFTHVKGNLRNTGDKTIQYFKIVAEYEDQNGHVLDSTFTNSNKEIEPGDELRFSIMHPFDDAFKRVTIYITRLE